jgi:hypothetical protein
MACIKLLHVSAPRCYPQGVLQKKIIQVLPHHYWNDLNTKILKYTKLISKTLQGLILKLYDSVNRSRYKFVVVYTLYAACIQTSLSVLCDPKRSHPDGVCKLCRGGRCCSVLSACVGWYINQTKYKFSLFEEVGVQKLATKTKFLLHYYVLVLCVCKTWSLTSREVHRLMVFENTKICGSKRDKVKKGSRGLRNEELHNLHPSPNIIRVIK